MYRTYQSPASKSSISPVPESEIPPIAFHSSAFRSLLYSIAFVTPDIVPTPPLNPAGASGVVLAVAAGSVTAISLLSDMIVTLTVIVAASDLSTTAVAAAGSGTLTL